MGRRRSAERAAYWRGVISRQEASGQSIAAFCRDEGISQGSFFWWRRELARRQPATPQFVPLPIAATGASTDFEVRLPGGTSVVVPARFDASSLERLLQAVRGLERDDA